jgi:hypothetical protein
MALVAGAEFAGHQAQKRLELVRRVEARNVVGNGNNGTRGDRTDAGRSQEQRNGCIRLREGGYTIVGRVDRRAFKGTSISKSGCSSSSSWGEGSSAVIFCCSR